MALIHALPGDVIDSRPLRERLIATPSRALLRTRDLELMRLVLIAGERIPCHGVSAPSTVHVIEGCVRLELGDSHPTLDAGCLVMVEAHVAHEIVALQDSSLLVTMLQPCARSPGESPGTP